MLSAQHLHHTTRPSIAGILLVAAITPALATSNDTAREKKDGATPVLTSEIKPGHLSDNRNKNSALTLFAENDLGWSDKYYTSGLRAVYTTPAIFVNGIPKFFQDLLSLTPLAVPSPASPIAYHLHFAATHEFYTPKHETWRIPPPNDHPFAGLLYGTFGISSETENRLDSLEIELGILGPSAGGQRVQNDWHRVVNSPLSNGWHTQLRDEPIVQFAWTRIWRFQWLGNTGDCGGLELEWLPRLHLEAGTVRDYASAGWQWRTGWNLAKDFGTGLLHSSSALVRPAANRDNTRIWFFLDVQAEYWALNMPLDGNNWHQSRRVHSYPWVGQFSLGFATQFNQWRLAITEVMRTKEFRGQDNEISAYTSVSLNLSF
ncbi:MAG: lipid A deacylase LpxR family protein [Puniceicoccales bacterium]|jgi:hypothetical protein|nr:lipid A deacylase LpxR family protein [Puniceicoccales bacterium]